MSNQKWIIGALLLLPGAIGLTFYGVQKHTLRQQFEQARLSSAQNPVSQEYLQMYELWSRLPAEEKSENPWGQGQYGGPEIQKKLRDGQADRFLADLPDLENNITRFPQELAEVMYGSDWQRKLELYQHDRSVAEIVLISSTFLLACGSILSAGAIVKALFAAWRKNRAEQVQAAKTDDPTASVSMPEVSADAVPAEQTADAAPENTMDAEPIEAAVSSHRKKNKKDPHSEGYFKARSKEHREAAPDQPAAQESAASLINRMTPLPAEASENTQPDNYFGWAVELDEKPELKTLMTPEPLTKELSELTSEVSAIRHFAAQQQDQMRKLQDGYDWMIVRRFCMRIIRCVDNIEDRILRLKQDDQVLSDHLQDIRDELIFALESSGVERYEPDLNISYKGLERYAEAIKERVYTKDVGKAGFIAEVIRPGYQYLVNDEDVKIVRCAQIKLYEVGQNK